MFNMNKETADLLGLEFDSSDKVMQCEECKGFYPVPYNYNIIVACPECYFLGFLIYNQTCKEGWEVDASYKWLMLGY